MGKYWSHTEESKAKMRETKRANPPSAEARRVWRDNILNRAVHPRVGKKHSDATKAQMSKSQKERWARENAADGAGL